MKITKKNTQSPHQIESINALNLNAALQAFVIYVRTLQFLKTRLKGVDENEAIHIPQSEILGRFFSFSTNNYKNEIQKLVKEGQLKLIERINPKNGHRIFYYAAIQQGPIDLFLIKTRTSSCDSDFQQMIAYLQNVSIDPAITDLPLYFESFLNFKNDCINLFFTIDDFSGRVHTPVTSLKSELRSHLLLYDQSTIGIDIVTMQPLLLGNILKENIGENEYSKWIESGEDIYTLLQKKARLQSREEGKKRFFEILFSPANEKLAQLFGDSDWISWINFYKKQPEPRNPHSATKPHSNLAWLLQSTEVSLMRKVWKNLIEDNIPFLSVHDEIIVRQSDQDTAEVILRNLFNKDFPSFKLNIKKKSTHTCPASEPRNRFKHLYIGTDGLLYLHIPDLPNL